MQTTLLYASLCALLLLALSWRVVRLRRMLRVGLGDGGEAALQRAVRIHGNFLEYAPLALLLLALLEIDGLAAAWLHVAGSVLIVSRLLHAWGLSRSAGTSFGRFTGTLGTWLVLLGLAGAGLARVLF